MFISFYFTEVSQNIRLIIVNNKVIIHTKYNMAAMFAVRCVASVRGSPELQLMPGESEKERIGVESRSSV